MRNLLFILAILSIIAIVIICLLFPQFKNINFEGITTWLSNISTELNQETNNNENLNIDNQGVEDVGDLNFYTIELGRSDADIQSKLTYTFYLPVDIVYELQGVDASSSILLFKKDGQEIFKLTNFDYAKTDDQIDESWPTADDYSFVGGHTNILELLNDDYEDEMYIFADTLKIDDEPVF